VDERSVPKRILESNVIGKRHIGKPKKRWASALEIDSREIFKAENWKENL
jgi:hypothetical protein